MHNEQSFETTEDHRQQRQGNIWSGVVALALLAMFALALVASEIESTAPDGVANSAKTAIAGQ
ncbi:MAG: hypothetical protein AAF270_15825 [Pseudomonadota bacterium]